MIYHIFAPNIHPGTELFLNNQHHSALISAFKKDPQDSKTRVYRGMTLESLQLDPDFNAAQQKMEMNEAISMAEGNKSKLASLSDTPGQSDEAPVQKTDLVGQRLQNLSLNTGSNFRMKQRLSSDNNIFQPSTWYVWLRHDTSGTMEDILFTF